MILRPLKVMNFRPKVSTAIPGHTRMRSRYAHGWLCKYAAAYWLYPITRELKPELMWNFVIQIL